MPAADTDTRVRRPHRGFLLINRNFALLWSGHVISMIGDFVFSMTVTLWVAIQPGKGQGWAPLAMSGILLAGALPIFFIGPLAGVFVDRWNRRQTMLWMDAIRVALISSLLLTTGIIPLPGIAQGHLPLAWQLGAMYIVVFLESTCAQFFNPSRFALIAMTVGEADQGHASGLAQIPESLAFLVGPVLGTVLFIAVGLQWALLLDALSFAVSFLTVFAMSIPPVALSSTKPPGKFFQEFWEGLRTLLGQPILRTLLVTSLLITCNEGALNTLDIFFVTGNLHTSANLYGLLGTGFGVGFIPGAVLSSRYLQRFRVVKSFWLPLLAEGVVILVYARMTSFFPGLLLMVLFGVLVGIVNVTSMFLTLQAIRSELLGRVMAVRVPASTLTLMLSGSLAGYLDSTLLRGLHISIMGFAVGPVDSIFTLTGLLAVCGGLYALCSSRADEWSTLSKAM